MKRIYLYLWIIFLGFLLSLPLRGETVSYIFTNYIPSSVMNPPLSPQNPETLESLGRLYANFSRRLQDYDERSEESDTLHWSANRTAEEALQIFDSLMEQRGKLSKSSSEPFVREIQVRRIFQFWRFTGSSHPNGYALMSRLFLDFYQMVLSNDEVSANIVAKYENAIEEEIKAALKEGLSRESVEMLIDFCKMREDNPVETLKRWRPYYDKSPEIVLLDKAIYEYGVLRSWTELAQKYIIHPDESKKRELLIADRSLVDDWNKLRKRAGNTPYAKTLEEERATLLPERLELKARVLDVLSGKVSLTATMIVRHPVVLSLRKITDQGDAKVKDVRQFALPDGGLYVDCVKLEDSLPTPGNYWYKLIPKGSSKIQAGEYVRYAQIDVDQYRLGNEFIVRVFGLENGVPLPGITLSEFRDHKPTGRTYTTDDKGMVKVPLNKVSMRMVRLTDRRLPEGKVEIWLQQALESQKRVPDDSPLEVYTDRPLYRYGQTLHVGIVTKRPTPKGAVVSPNQSGTLRLVADRNDLKETLQAKEYRTSEHGVAELTFEIPADETLSNFRLVYGDKEETVESIRVESYKLNHLSVQVDSIPSGVVSGEPMTLFGTTTDMNGNHTPANVELTLMISGKRKVFSVSSSGNFTIVTDTFPTPKSKELRDYVRAYLRATDHLGNVATDYHSLLMTTSALPLDADRMLPGTNVDKNHMLFATLSQPYHDNLLKDLEGLTVQLQLKDTMGKLTHLGSVPTNGEVTLSRPDIPSGLYTIVAIAKDRKGNVSTDESQPKYLFDPKDQHLNADKVAWLVAPKVILDGDESLQLLVGSSYDTHLQLDVMRHIPEESGEELILSRTIRVKNAIQKGDIPASQLGKGNVYVRLRGVHQGDVETETVEITRNTTQGEITIQAEDLDGKSFVPGQQIHPTLVIRDNTGEPLRDANVIMTIYDQAIVEASYDGGKWWILRRWKPSLTLSSAFGSNLRVGMVLSENPVMSMSQAEASVEKKESLSDASPESGTQEVRRNFAETAYFSALLRTDSEGRVSPKIILPDTQTKYLTKGFVFSQDLKQQKITDFHFTVQAPLSIEIGLPRYLIQGDQLIGDALIRNSSALSQSVEYALQLGEREIAHGSSSISPGGVAVVPFELQAPLNLTDTLTLMARVSGSEYRDAVVRKLPLRSAMSTYGVASPFSVYKKDAFSLSLPKVEQADGHPTLHIYTDPMALICSTLALEHEDISKVSDYFVYEALHRYTTYATLENFLSHHPEVVSSLREAILLLRSIDSNSEKEQEHLADRAKGLQRKASPKTLADFYQLISSPDSLSIYVNALKEQLLRFRSSDGCWTFVDSYRSPWLTLYVLDRLSQLPEEVCLKAWKSLAAQSLAYLEKSYASPFRFSPMRFAIIQSKFGLRDKALPTQMQKDLREMAEELRKNHRNLDSYSLIPYAEYARIYESPEVFRDVLQFVRDRSRFTRSDDEKAVLMIYLSEIDEKISPDLISLLLRLKQGALWNTSSAMDALTLLLGHVSPTKYGDTPILQIGDMNHPLTLQERALGEIHIPLTSFSPEITIHTKDVRTDYLYGGVLYTVTEPAAEVTPTGSALKVDRSIYVRRMDPDTHKTRLVAVDRDNPAIKGEPLVVRYTVETDRDLSLLTIEDARPAGAEPGYDFRGYRFSDRIFWVYRRLESTDRLYIDYIPRGKHILEMQAVAAHSGIFTAGPAKITSYFAPEFKGNSAGTIISIHSIPH